MKKNCSLVVNSLLNVAFMSSNFTGAPGKRSFSETHNEVVEVVTEIIKDRFPSTTTAEVAAQFKIWFNYVVQEAKRQAEKQFKNKKD